MSAPEFTLADRVLQWTHDPWRNTHLPKACQDAAEPGVLQARQDLKQARRMYLDPVFLDALTGSNTVASPNEILARCDLANLPFNHLWVEFDNWEMEQALLRHGMSSDIIANVTKASDPILNRIGYLFVRLDPANPTCWRTSKYSMSLDQEAVRPDFVSYIFGDYLNKRKMFARLQEPGNEKARALVEKTATTAWGLGVRTPDTGKWGPVFSKALLDRGFVLMDQRIAAPISKFDEYSSYCTENYLEDVDAGRGMLYWLVSMLATINYVPMRYRTVQRGGFYKKRLKNLPYLDHQVVSIEAGKVRNIPRYVGKLLARAAKEAQRRRGHDVRGHWRHHLNTPRCAEYDQHVWRPSTLKAYEECARCQSMRRWIEHHVRGDASLGWVSHDYLVET